MRKKNYDKLREKALAYYDSLTDEQKKEFAILGMVGCLSVGKNVFSVLSDKSKG